MPIEQSLLADFSGGEIEIVASTNASESEWSLLKGFVLNEENELRAQWSGATWTY